MYPLPLISSIIKHLQGKTLFTKFDIHWGYNILKYLGLVVDGDKFTIDPKKADGLWNWPCTSKTVKEVWSILGVLGYQWPFIKNYANIAWPLVMLTKKDHPFIWTHECHMALDTLINIIHNNPSLWQPDLSKPFFLQVDASALQPSPQGQSSPRKTPGENTWPLDFTLRCSTALNAIMTSMTGSFWWSTEDWHITITSNSVPLTQLPFSQSTKTWNITENFRTLTTG